MPPRKRTAPRPSRATGDVSPSEVEAAKKKIATSKQEYADQPPEYLDDDDGPIPAELNFETAQKDRSADPDDPDDVIEFMIDGQLCVAVRPDPGAWILLIRSLGSSKTFVDRVEAIMSIVDDTFDDATKFYVHSRLRARGDSFDVEILAKVVNALVDKWTPKEGNRAQRRQTARSNASR